MNRFYTRDEIVTRLDKFERASAPESAVHVYAAVALVIINTECGQGVWITERAPRLRHHAGQFALPGGRLEPGEDAVTAAARETLEEIGIQLNVGNCLGLLDDYMTRSGFVITPIVFWGDNTANEPNPSPAEVSKVLYLSFGELTAEPYFIAIPESGRPVIQLPILGQLVHAPTGAILHQFAELVIHNRVTRVAELEQPVFAWS